MTPEAWQPVESRDRRLRWLDSSLALLLVVLMWSLVIEVITDRARQLQASRTEQIQRWQREGVRQIDRSLSVLQRELALFDRPDDEGLAMAASTLYPMESGQLWQVGLDELILLRGTGHVLTRSETDAVRQLLAQQPASDRLFLLPAALPNQPDRLQLVRTNCAPTRHCDRALTGFVRLDKLLGDELLRDMPHYVLTDSQGNQLAGNMVRLDSLPAVLPAQAAELVNLPLLLTVSFDPAAQSRPFMLFALYVVAVAAMATLLLALLVLRVNRKLGYIIQHSQEVSLATHLLTLTNSSLRERLQRLSEEQRDQQTLIDTVQVGVLMLDTEQHTIFTSNEAALRVLGYSRQSLFRKDPASLFADPEVYRQLMAQLPSQPVNDRETELLSRNGDRLWVMLSMRTLLFREHRAIALSFVDITERQQHAQRLQAEKLATERALAQLQSTQHELYQRATRDDLTGIANRRHFLGNAGKLQESCLREQQPFAVAILDIDRFKSINDQYGHAAGDAVLRSVSARLDGLLPEQALFGRMGGEEFALALPGHDLASAHAVLDHLRETVAREALDFDGLMLTVTFSAGVASQRHAQDTLSSLLNAADHAMYRAKHGGRNRVESAIRTDFPA